MARRAKIAQVLRRDHEYGKQITGTRPSVEEEQRMLKEGAPQKAAERKSTPPADTPSSSPSVQPKPRALTTASASERSAPVTVRLTLRPLQRQMGQILELSGTGYAVTNILKHAAGKLDKSEISPVFVEHVTEEWSKGEAIFKTFATDQHTLDVISEKMMDLGVSTNAARIRGQVETAWIAALDETIKTLMEKIK